MAHTSDISPAAAPPQASTGASSAATTTTSAKAGSNNNAASMKKSSERIRSNLLHKLGIENTAETAEQIAAAKTPPRSLLGDANIRHEPLKSGNDDDDTSNNDKSSSEWLGLFSAGSPSTSSPTSVASETPPKSQRRLVFHDEVTVVPIPMRDEYSDRVKERLWNNANEILYNAHRNSVEFAAEGWDWRNATEEEGMYECSVTGEKIHPVHVETDMMSEDDEDY